MYTGTIKGSLTRLWINGATVACETSCDFNFDSEMIPTNHPGSAGWDEFISGLLSWTMSVNGNLLLTSAGPDIKTVLQAVQTGEELALEFKALGDAESYISIKGQALPQSGGISAPLSGKGNWTVVFQGTGPFELDFQPLYSSLKGFDFPFGFATKMSRIITVPKYVETLDTQARSMTSENELKIETIRTTEDTWNFGNADKFVAFTQERQIRAHGHTLIWAKNSGLPNWMDVYATSYEAMKEVIRVHIYTVVGRYKGKIGSWDVVNEAFNDNGTYRSSIVYQAMGDEFMYWSFKYAHDADPDALLFYNDYGYEYGNTGKTVKTIEALNKVRALGGRVDGVGMQTHTRYQQSLSTLKARIKMFADAGYKVHISEVDVAMRNSQTYGFVLTPALSLAQANYYKGIVQAYIEVVPAGQRHGITTWSVSDGDHGVNSGLSSSVPLKDYPVLFDRQYGKKEAFHAIIGLLKGLGAAPTYPRPLMGDDFNRYDGTLNGSIASIGSVTAVWQGADTVNGLRILSGTAGGKSQTVESTSFLDFGYTNYKAYWYVDRISSDGNNRRLYAIFRHVDKSNYYAVYFTVSSTWKVSRWVDGREQLIYSSVKKPSNGDILSINMNNNVMELAINGTIVFTGNEVEHYTSTRIGIKSYGIRDNSSAWDAMRIYAHTAIVNPPGTLPVLPAEPKIADDFEREDGTLDESEAILGYDPGQWIVDSVKGLGISEGRAKGVSGKEQSIGTIDHDLNTFRLIAKVDRVYSQENRRMYLIFRYISPTNYFVVSASGTTGFWTLAIMRSGVQSNLYVTNKVSAANDVLTVNVTEYSVELIINGTSYVTLETAEFAGSTQAGLKAYGVRDNYSGWSEFEIYEI